MPDRLHETFLESKNQCKTESFDEKMAVRPKGTQKAHNDMKVNFNRFCESNYDGRDSKEVLDEIVAIEDNDIDKVMVYYKNGLTIIDLLRN